MPTNGHIRHLFPGGNTSQGFYSYYDYILPQEIANRIIVIKGGPGVGKSSFMRKIGEDLFEEGYDLEFMHCSSDNNSLDGIVIPKLKAALIDGTAPHIVDPKNPGCVDEIIHLGDYWDEDGIIEYKKEIMEANKEISSIFNRAYRYLKAAKNIYDDIEIIYGKSTNFAKVNKLCEELIEKLFGGLIASDNIGKSRHLFASAITPDGLKNFIDSLLAKVENIYILKGEPGIGKSTTISQINIVANIKGLDTEVYHCAFDPVKIDHLYIPILNTMIVTSNEYHNIYKTNGEEIIDFNKFTSNNEIKKYATELNYDKKVFNELLNQAITTISSAKRLHDLMETYYIPNMDFEKVEKKRIETLNRLKNLN